MLTGVTDLSVGIQSRDGVSFNTWLNVRVAEQVVNRNYRATAVNSWLIDPALKGEAAMKVLEEAGAVRILEYTRLNSHDHTAAGVVDLSPTGIDCLLYIDVRISLTIHIAGKNSAEVVKAYEKLRALFPRYELPRKPEEPKSHVNFWMMTPQGPQATTRLLDVTTWKDVEGNYPSGVARELERLVQYKPEKSGQIVMLHGDPGVGKTWLLRVLSWEWQSWCTMHYVMDPDHLLNGSPGYMTELLFSNSGPDPMNMGGMFPEGLDGDVDESPLTLHELPAVTTKPRLFGADRWRLIILEDTGELMTMDAAARGHGLGRLLNSADGMLGQGSRVLFLMTTNEPIEKIHPAISRPGRALANIHFDPFPVEEGREWVKKRGGDPSKVKEKKTLAQLYALVGEVGTQQVETKEKKAGLGFGPSAPQAPVLREVKEEK